MLKNFGCVKSEDLSLKSSFRIGGEALCFYPFDENSLLQALPELKSRGYAVLGGMSNVLIPDAKFSKIAVFLSDESFCNIEASNGLYYIGAGCKISQAINYMLQNALSGLEFAVGLPCVLGGLLRMNASFCGESVSDNLCKVRVIDVTSEKIREISKEDLAVKYRDLGVNDSIILGAYFEFKNNTREKLKQKLANNIAFRKDKQDWLLPSAGCVFRNPAGYSAGKLIDEAGLKGLREGGAMVSEKHANFIVNIGGAKAEDVISLIEIIKKNVYEKFRVILEEEIKIL